MFGIGENNQAVDISWSAIFKAALALAVGYAIYLAREVLLLALFGLIISVLFNPAIDFLLRLKIPRTAATLSVYFLVLGVLGTMIYLDRAVFYDRNPAVGPVVPGLFPKNRAVFVGIGVRDFSEHGRVRRRRQGLVCRRVVKYRRFAGVGVWRHIGDFHGFYHRDFLLAGGKRN